MINQNLPIQWTERKVAVDSLTPYERNPRHISEAAFANLKASLQSMGYHQRIIAQPDLKVIGGHQRIKALKELGISEIVILVPDRKLTPEEFKRLLVSDNLPFGEFDFDMLQSDFQINDLKDWGMPADWLARATPKFDDTNAENTPPLQDKPTSQIGDVWCLGSHRLLCGDSTQPDHVKQLLGDNCPNIMITDPPYGVEYDANWRNERTLGAGAVGNVLNDDKADWREAWALFPGNIAYVWHAGRYASIVQASLESVGFKMRSQIIWAKNSLVIGRGDYHWQHDTCWYAVRNKGDWHGDRKQSTLWQIQNMHRTQGNVDDGKTNHSTQKPVECMRRPMLNNTAEGDAVYDPFMGSGTTLIAAEQTGRVAYGVELAPQYVDLICRRYTQFCNKPVTLLGDTRTFSEIEKSRS